MKKILLHGCCGDCIWKMADSAANEEVELTLFYYNPNIHPRSEYQSRLKAMQMVTEKKGIKIIIPDWKPSEYFEATGGNTPGRCEKCWRLRLEKTAAEAKIREYDFFSTTLLTSLYQNEAKVRQIGEEVGEKYGINFWSPKVIIKEAATKGFYKQIYCGCIYSLTERWEEKYIIKTG